MSVKSALDRVRQPEYTGENRCMPCTLVNLAIAVVVCAVLAYVWWLAAVGFGGIALVSIALRGYLVPGTPAITRRYLPDRVLALFDKKPVTTVKEREIDTDTFDTERILLEAGVVEPCADIDDLCLAPAFHDAWYGRMDEIDTEGTRREALADVLDTDEEIEFVEHGEAFTAYIDTRFVSQWESRAALIADLAAALSLPEWIRTWDAFDATEQGTLIHGLRVFVETCPTCGGAVMPSQETVQSCCRKRTVVAIVCEECGARLFETTTDAVTIEGDGS